MKALRFVLVVLLALISYPLGIVYGCLVRAFRYVVYLLVLDFQAIASDLYELGVRMSSVLNAVSATWLDAWLTRSGFTMQFGDYFPVSALLGKAHYESQLTSVGAWVHKQLETIDPGHCKKAAQKHGLIPTNDTDY